MYKSHIFFVAVLIIEHRAPEIKYFSTFRHSYPPNDYSLWSFAAEPGFFVEVRVVRSEPDLEISSIYIGLGEGGFHQDSWTHLQGDIDLWEPTPESSLVTIIVTSGGRRSGSGFTITCSAGMSVTHS